MKKKEFLKTVASKQTKTVSALSWIIALVCIALVVAGAYLSLTRSIFDLPAVDYAIKVIGSGDDIVEEFQTFLKDDELYNYAKTSYEENLEFLTEEEKALGQKALDDCTEFMKSPNLINTRAFYMSVFECIEHDNPTSKAYAAMYDYAHTYGNAITYTLNGIIIAILAVAALAVLFLLISAGTKSIGLVIVTIILDAILNVLLVGIPFAVITAVALIVLTVFISIVNKAYKTYLINKASEAAQTQE